jgi:hypothetical protein
MMIYGESGTGKTTLAGSADAVPMMRPVLVVDIEGGTESLRHAYPEVELVRVKTWKEMQGLYNVLYDGNSGFQTVVLDSLTEIQKFNMDQVMIELMGNRPDLDPDIPGMREWGKSLEQVRKMVRGFRDLPVHTIFTALAKSDKDAKSGIVTMKPSLPGKLADEVAAFLDIVGYYYTKEITNDEGEPEQKRLLLTQKTEKNVAKDRSGRLPVVVESPTMANLFEYIYPPKKTELKPEPQIKKTEPQKVGN